MKGLSIISPSLQVSLADAVTRWWKRNKGLVGFGLSTESCERIHSNMETSIACHARGGLLPKVSSQHSTSLVSPLSISPSFNSKVHIFFLFYNTFRCQLEKCSTTILINLVAFMTDSEIELPLRWIFKNSPKIISKGFKKQELFNSTKVCYWW